MAVLPKCPSCGFESTEVRCPRCNALKVIGCSGSCALCGSKVACANGPLRPGDPKPSDAAADDEAHPGTPLER